MEQRWNLDALYTSFECTELQDDLSKLKSSIINFKNWVSHSLIAEGDESNKLYYYTSQSNQLNDLLVKIYSYSLLNYSVNTSDTKALKLIEKVESYFPELTTIEVKFQKWLKTLNNLEKILQSDSYLLEHKFFITEMEAKAKYLLSDSEEELIALMKNTGSKAFEKLQQTMNSTLLVDINIAGEDKQLPLSIVRNLAYDKDATTRKTAYEAELKSYPKVEKTSCACLNGIKGEVITLAKKKGYESPLEMTLISSRMDKQTLDAMITAIKDYLPSFKKYLNKKASMLGHKNGLPFYDLFAPVGNVNKTYTYEQAKDFIVDNFSNFSSNLGNYANNAFENNWIDAEPREGKEGGAYCQNLHCIKESRIMANFTGVFNDVTTLAHELGHGYHGYCLKDVQYLNSDYPMPLAETASIFCETIVINSAIKNATKEEAIGILESDLMSSTQVIVDILSRYLFETELFKRRKDSSLSVDELKEIMIQAQKEAYGDGLDYNYLHPYMWICKPHYYFSESNFYNFPYAFGLLFAKGLYSKYLQMGEAFIPKYDELLKSTGCNNIKDVLKILDVDAHSVDFYRSSLEIIKKDIDKFIKIC